MRSSDEKKRTTHNWILSFFISLSASLVLVYPSVWRDRPAGWKSTLLQRNLLSSRSCTIPLWRKREQKLVLTCMSSPLLSSEKGNKSQFAHLSTNADQTFVDLHTDTHKEDQWPGLTVEEPKVIFDRSFDDRKEHRFHLVASINTSLHWSPLESDCLH